MECPGDRSCRWGIPHSGYRITLTFTEDLEEPPTSFVSGDRWSFAASAPQASTTAVNAAIDVLLDSQKS